MFLLISHTYLDTYHSKDSSLAINQVNEIVGSTIDYHLLQVLRHAVETLQNTTSEAHPSNHVYDSQNFIGSQGVFYKKTMFFFSFHQIDDFGLP